MITSLDAPACPRSHRSARRRLPGALAKAMLPPYFLNRSEHLRMATLQWFGLSLILTAGVAAGLSGGCAGGDTGSHSATSSSGAGGGHAGSGLPCDIESIASKCGTCHSNPPLMGVPMPLLTYEDFVAHSKSTPAKTYAELAAARMSDMLNPMPPMGSAPSTSQEVAAMSAWVQGGMPVGSCDGGAAMNPFAMPPMCSTMTTWTMGNASSNQMLPGTSCVACHNEPQDGALLPPPLIVGGTVYQTGHEPDNCNGGPPDPLDKAIVEITDANKKVYMLQVNLAGNFFWAIDQGAMVMPFTARVLYQGRVRTMAKPQTSGDCNSCHSQDGESGAPGRIALP
jgi:hypothetical protein